MAKVGLENVDKIYEGHVKVVDDVNLDIDDGSFVVLVGPSGCGKSTTLRMIAGLEDITRGTIRIGDRVVNHVPPKERNIAMVFQNYALYPHMNVFDNMAFSLKLRKHAAKVISQKVSRAASLLGIEHLLERKPAALSGGQRQRVALGRAIVRDPECFLFDEPLSNLDAKLRVTMRAELKRLHLELGSTTIYVTHDQEEAMTLGDQLVVMKDGVIQQRARAAEIYHRPANRFVAGFLGSPPMNFIEFALREESGDLSLVSGRQRLPVPAWARTTLLESGCASVVLGVRPEAVRVEPRSDDAGTTALGMSVALVQPLGDRSHVHLASNGHPSLIAQVPSQAAYQTGQSAHVSFDMDRVHFFETTDVGRCLASPGSQTDHSEHQPANDPPT